MIKPREKAPELEIKLVNNTSWKLSEQPAENFTMIVFYRGLHCPVCKLYLEDLQTQLPKFVEEGVKMLAISTDKETVDKETYEKWNIKDVSDQIKFWDAGAEKNEAPFYGPNTVTNQSAPNTGVAENGVVELLSEVGGGYTYPAVKDVIKVTIERK